jgi:MFS family permease
MTEGAGNGAAGVRRVHYAWVVAGTGTLCIVACLGFGRFTLGMLLPSMASSLGLSYSRLGTLGTANFLGYLAAVLFCGEVARRTGPRLLIFVSLLLVGASMLVMSRAGGFAPLVVLYALTGVGSGATNVPVQGLVARWFASKMRGRAAGIVSAGSGVAIVLSGWFVPLVNRKLGAEGWRTSWLLLGLAVTAIAVVSVILFRNDPAEKRLRPLGVEERPAAVAEAARPAPARFHRNRAVYLLGALYAIFGCTYAVYVTFVVLLLVRERGFSESAAGSFWSVVGVLSLASGPLFGGVSDRFGHRTGLVAAFALLMLAYLLAGARLPDVSLYASIACFGIVAWAVPTIMVAAVSDHVGAHNALPAFGFVTFFFGIGQVIGPAVAGVVAERTGSFSSSFLGAAALAALAVALSRGLRRPVSVSASSGPPTPSRAA